MFSFTYPGRWDHAGYQGFYYLRTWPKDSKTLQSVTEPHSCREFFVRAVRGRISKTDVNDIQTKKAYTLVTLGRPTVSLFNSWKSKLDNIMTASVHVINAFETKHKWPLTKIYPVKSTDNLGIPFIFVVGSRKWTMSPYLMSTWTLALRMGKTNWPNSKILKMNSDQIVRMIKNTSSTGGDRAQIARTLPHWGRLMSNYNHLFGNIERKYNWSLARLSGKPDRPEGVLKLVTGVTGEKALLAKYKELVKKELAKEEAKKTK